MKNENLNSAATVYTETALCEEIISLNLAEDLSISQLEKRLEMDGISSEDITPCFFLNDPCGIYSSICGGKFTAYS
jgi:hypothetical protein